MSSKRVDAEELDGTPGIVARVEKVFEGWSKFDEDSLTGEDASGILEDLRVALYGG